MDVFDGDLQSIKTTGFSELNFLIEPKARFSLTMPSLAAKKARTWEIKCFSFLSSFSQSVRSLARSISSAVQKTAICFLYISQIFGF